MTEIETADERPGKVDDQAVPRSSSAAGSYRFVGRARETALLAAAFEEARAGRGRLAMLAGEPGIGKTRTAEELAAYAESRGAFALWGRVHEEAGSPPYWPWVQVLRSCIGMADRDTLEACLGRDAGVVARIVPEMETLFERLPAPPVLNDPEAERFRLFDAVSRFLAALSKKQPLVIVLDDLHWADESSLKLLEFLSHELCAGHLLVVGIYRDTELDRTHPLSRALGDICRENRLDRITLRGLPKSDTARLIETYTGSDSSAELVDLIHSRTEGNPLFIRELVRCLAEEERLNDGDSGEAERPEVEIPEGVRAVIGRRLNRLSEGSYRLLRAAAVMGREFEPALLARLIDGFDDERIAEAVREALGIRVIEEVPEAIGRCRFGHQLIQETLRGELTMTERVRLHARIAEELEKRYGDAADEHAAELAYHFTEARILLGTDKLVRYSISAGRRAKERCAYEEATRIYERALDVVGDRPVDERIVELLGVSRDIYYYVWEIDRAIATAIRLFEYYEGCRRFSDLAFVAMQLHHMATLCSSAGSADAVYGYCRRAIELCESAEVKDPHILLNLYWFQGPLTGDYDTVEKNLRRIVSEAEKADDRSLRKRALMILGAFFESTGKLRSALASWEQAWAIQAEPETPGEKWHHYETRAYLNLDTGNPEEALRDIARAEQAAEILRVPRPIASECHERQRIALETGDWPEARSCFERGMRVLERMHHACPETYWLLEHQALAEYEAGDFERGEECMERLIAYRRDHDAPWHIDFAIVYNSAIPRIARITGSERWFDVAVDAARSCPPPFAARWHHTANLGMVAAVRGDRAEAAGRYEELLPRTVEVRGHLGRQLGVISRAAGRLEEALGHFEEGYRFTRDAGYHPRRAWICRDWAEALLARGAGGDAARAGVLLEEGLAVTERLGMEPLRGQIVELCGLHALKIRPAYPDGLTGREVEVLELIAGGMTNREIAYELSISPRTAATHIRHIFEKTGLTNRVSAATYVIEKGLVE